MNGGATKVLWVKKLLEIHFPHFMHLIYSNNVPNYLASHLAVRMSQKRTRFHVPFLLLFWLGLNFKICVGASYAVSTRFDESRRS